MWNLLSSLGHMLGCSAADGDKYLGEANVLGVLTEALTADVESVLADKAPLVGAHSAAGTGTASQNWHLKFRWHLGRQHDTLQAHEAVVPIASFSCSHIPEREHRQHEQQLTTCGRPCCGSLGGSPTPLDVPSRQKHFDHRAIDPAEDTLVKQTLD